MTDIEKNSITINTASTEGFARLTQEVKLKEEAEIRGKKSAKVSSEILAEIEAQAKFLEEVRLKNHCSNTR